MFDEIFEGTRFLIGRGNDDLTVWQMPLRAIIIYLTAILLVRVGQKRFMGKNTAFDMILGIIIGSVLSRAITGNAAFIPTIAAGAVLVAMHWIFSVLSFHFNFFGGFVKGREHALIRDGEIQWDNMRKSHISRKDLETALRTAGKVTHPGDVKEAHFERSGDISVIPYDRHKQLRTVDIRVEDGVQTVRLELAGTE